MRPEGDILLDGLAELANDAWEAYGQAAAWAEPEEIGRAACRERV